MITIRPFADDYAAVAALLNTLNPEPITAESLQALHARFPAEGRRHRVVAEAGDLGLVGYANVSIWPGNRPGDSYFTLVTAPTFRRQGAGSGLLAAVEDWARANGVARLITGVPDEDQEALSFAAHRGFPVESTQLMSTLELATFDEAQFVGVVESVQTRGIRFFTYAEQPGEALQRLLYEVYKVTDLETPGYAGTDPSAYPPFERWQGEIFGNQATLTDGLIIAADGDRIVGLTIVQNEGEPGSLYTEYTGVLAAYRGRQIGMALKLLSVRFARRFGARSLWTKNNSQNRPMLAINDKMGYVKTEGRSWVVKTLV